MFISRPLRHLRIVEMSGKAVVIEVFSTHCVRCRRLEFMVQQAVSELGLEADVRTITDIDEMERRGVKGVPALAIDGKVVSPDELLTVSRLKELVVASSNEA